jgi:group I intron endonuclease
MIDKTGVYMITNIVDGKIYVGSSKDVELRFRQHQKSLKGGYHINKHLQNAWSKYGEQAFKFEVIEYCSPDVMIELEQDLIESLECLDRKKGYNLMPAAPGNPYTEEIRKKISEANRRRRLSPESRKRISESLKGNKNILTEKNRNALRKAVVDKPLTEEHKRKISESLKGKKRSKESRNNMKGAKRLSAQEKAEIEYELVNNPDVVQRDLAKKYGVSPGSIQRIKRIMKERL